MWKLKVDPDPGALVTVTGVVFSITMLTLAQTSTMYGPRLLRSFLNHNLTQFTLALFEFLLNTA